MSLQHIDDTCKAIERGKWSGEIKLCPECGAIGSPILGTILSHRVDCSLMFKIMIFRVKSIPHLEYHHCTDECDHPVIKVGLSD